MASAPNPALSNTVVTQPTKLVNPAEPHEILTPEAIVTQQEDAIKTLDQSSSSGMHGSIVSEALAKMRNVLAHLRHHFGLDADAPESSAGEVELGNDQVVIAKPGTVGTAGTAGEARAAGAAGTTAATPVIAPNATTASDEVVVK